jgi:hypothetical protein
VGQIRSLDKKIKIYTEEPEGQIKITDKGVDKNLDIKGY